MRHAPRQTDGCRCDPLNGSIAWVNGVHIEPMTPEAALGRVERHLSCPATHVVNPVAAYPTVMARRDPRFTEALNRGDLNLPDGMGVVWACRAQGFRGTPRVYGPELMLRTSAWGEDRGITHSFVGGSQETLDALLAALRVRTPGIRVVGAYAPPFREVTAEAVAEDVQHLPDRSDVLWVGLGSPKQQWWGDFARAHSPATVILTVGAAFDFIGGTKRQAPRWIRQASLEWLFRLMMEPRRLWRRELVDNAVFAWNVGGDLMRERLRRNHR